MASAGVPQQVLDGFSQASSSGQVDLNQLTGVGDLGAALLAAIPEAFRAAVEPFIPAMVEGIHQAFSLATAQTFWLGVVGAIVAAAAAVAIKEIPLRATNDAPVPTAAVGEGASTATGPTPASNRPAPSVD